MGAHRSPDRAKAAPVAKVPAWASGSPDVLADATVLIVDDQAANVFVLERLLQLAGASNIHAVTDPREAVAKCIELRPDLLLLDLHMPHLDGVAVLEALRATLPATVFMPVLVLTADATSEARERALRAGAKDFLTKPFDRTEVLLRVSNLLETRALYGQLERHNIQLQVALDARLAEERREAAERRLRADRIREVIRDGLVRMVFQPVVAVGSGEIVGVEALARFETEPVVPPDRWFADARDLGMDTELELTAARAAFDRLPELPDGVFMAVNLSPAVVMAAEVEEIFAREDGRRVVLELTEYTKVADYTELLRALDALRYQGVRVAVDDAGSGYAGLHHILQLQPDILKIDIDLISGLDRDPPKRALVRSLVAFAAELGATIVAEGIETADELDVLRRLDVDWGQGYHLARPGPLPASFRPVNVVLPSVEGE